jgi:hypothetical protein
MRRGSAHLHLVLAAAVAILGGISLVAWKTTYFDSVLPSQVRVFLGRGGVSSSPQGSAETQPVTPSDHSTSADLTKSWKTYTNSVDRYTFRYPEDWSVEENAYQGVDGPVTVFTASSGEYPEMSVQKNFQGGFENLGPDSSGEIYTKDGTVVYRGVDKEIPVHDGGKVAHPNYRMAGVRILTPGGKDYIDIFYHFDIKRNQGALDTFDLIISTFEFLP